MRFLNLVQYKHFVNIFFSFFNIEKYHADNPTHFPAPLTADGPLPPFSNSVLSAAGPRARVNSKFRHWGGGGGDGFNKTLRLIT
jgi:hypothetical protein